MYKLSSRVIIALSVLVLCVFLGVLLFSVNKSNKMASADHFYADHVVAPAGLQGPVYQSVATGSEAGAGAAAGAPTDSDPCASGFNNALSVGAMDANAPSAGSPSCFPKDRLTAQDLLPKDAANTTWAQMNPAGQGDVGDQNYLTSGYHIGIDSVGSSGRNANLQLRSDIPNPQQVVSPWLQSTIEPDLYRKSFEIGA